MRRCLGLLICLGVVLSVPPGPALANPLSLEQLINHALQHNQGLDETKWKVRGAEARLRQAKAAYILPRLRLESENGLVPEAAGNAFNTTSDTSGLRPLGPFTRSQLEFVQPLYTFGQLGNLHRAAAEGLSVDKAELEAARLQVGRDVQEYYYGLLLARDLQDLVLQLLEELEGRQDELDETVSLATTYKLELALLQLRSQASEAAHAHSLARRALAWTAGLDTTHPLELAEDSLQPVAFERPPLDSLTIAYTERPDWQQLMAGIAAKQALAKHFLSNLATHMGCVHQFKRKQPQDYADIARTFSVEAQTAYTKIDPASLMGKVPDDQKFLVLMNKQNHRYPIKSRNNPLAGVEVEMEALSVEPIKRTAHCDDSCQKAAFYRLGGNFTIIQTLSNLILHAGQLGPLRQTRDAMTNQNSSFLISNGEEIKVMQDDKYWLKNW